MSNTGEKHAGGRPPHYRDSDQMEQDMLAYFATQGAKNLPLTVTGLAYYLGFESRQSFYDYEKNEEFSYIIKRARLRIEQGYEERLSGNSVAGSIFALKNMGWIDSQSFDHTSQGNEMKGFIVNVKPFQE